ncbi:long-chain-fatty-acid--CoA ligase [Nocardioides sp. Bht2]|uniref:long-chain-fatty-acid--CoA ligase n=1 Tax=Nocardioides sp. Bht2 TaxID=3392297 RepID=UPI0039B40EB9
MPHPDASTHLISRLPDGQPLTRIADIIRSRAAATPDGVAMRTPAGATTFRQIDELSSRIAQGLVAAGVQPGDRVACISRNSPEFLAVLYGAAKAGAIATAVNILLAPREVTWIVEDADPRVVFVGPGEQHLVPAAEAAAGAPLVVSTATEALDAWLGELPALDPQADPSGDQPALILYSSGTTGNPKGVMLSGHNVAQALAAVQNLLELDDTSVTMAPIPFFHISGLGLALVATLVGAELLAFTPGTPAELLSTLRDQQVTHAIVVPTVIQRLLELPEATPGVLPRLRYVIYGAAPISPALLREAIALLECRFVQSYGLTESSGGVTILDHQDHQRGLTEPRLLRSAGRPLPSVDLRIVDHLVGEDALVGEPGEIWIRGSHRMLGYWRNPEATEQSLAGEWLRTGDIGHLDDEGYLFIVDRLKDMIISGGENVYPAEVESLLMSHPDVVECAVVGLPDERWGEVPLAVVVTTPGAGLSEDELIAWSRSRLANFKSPKHVRFVDALPRNASGKVLKRAIKAESATTSRKDS